MHTFKKVARLLLKRHSNRTLQNVKEIYEKSWDGALNEFYEFKFIPHAVLYGSKRGVQIALDDRRIPAHELNQFIQSVQPRSVAEMGSGCGIFLLSLAALNPDINFTGIELTAKGVEVANKFLNNPPRDALKYLTQQKAINFGKVEFKQGDMSAKLPMPANSVDLVYTKTAIEQIPRPEQYFQAYREAHRVTRNYAVFIEAFREYQNMYQLLHLYKKDFFRSSYKEVERCGFKIIGIKPISFAWGSTQEAMLICKKI